MLVDAIQNTQLNLHSGAATGSWAFWLTVEVFQMVLHDHKSGKVSTVLCCESSRHSFSCYSVASKLKELSTLYLSFCDCKKPHTGPACTNESQCLPWSRPSRCQTVPNIFWPLEIHSIWPQSAQIGAGAIWAPGILAHSDVHQATIGLNGRKRQQFCKVQRCQSLCGPARTKSSVGSAARTSLPAGASDNLVQDASYESS